MSFVVSVAAVVATVTLGYFSALRAQYERVLNVLDYISSSDVAAARHRLGTLIHKRHLVNPADDAVRQDLTKDMFTVLWAFGRIDAVRETLPDWRWFHGLLGGPSTLIRENTIGWVGYWHTHIADVVAVLDVEPDESRSGLDKLAAEWLGAPTP